MIIFEVGKALCKFKNCNQMGKSSQPFLSIGGDTVELWAEEVKHNAIVGLSYSSSARVYQANTHKDRLVVSLE